MTTEQTTAPRVLAHGDGIRLAAWASPSFATVFGIEGYALANNRDPQADRARAVERGHPVVGSIHTGSTLTDSRAFYERERERYAAAVVLEPGQIVEIEGARYRVEVVRGNDQFPRNSDPIRFVPA